jgi:hypothetical protein
VGAIADASYRDLFRLYGDLGKELKTTHSVEAAAQHAADFVYKAFKEKIVLSRVYGVVPYSALPAFNKSFVDKNFGAKGVPLRPETPILSLLGTCGVKPQWCDRRQSAGHVGIPLVSAAFVDSIPMLARLLSDLGAKINWPDKPTSGLSAAVAEWSGVFHVPDAKVSVDQKGRNIIPAQDFVAEQSVKTVFGLGGSYTNGSFFAMIFFTNEDLPKQAAERFMPLVTTFKAATAETVAQGKVFQ